MLKYVSSIVLLFQTLAETIENVVTHGRIQYASDKIKVMLGKLVQVVVSLL